MRSLILLVPLLFVAACATPQKRIERNPEIFAALPPEDQALASRGQVRKGMSMDGVFIAWGRPDRITRTVEGNDDRLTWIYLAYRNETIPAWRTVPRSRRYYDSYFGVPVYDPIYLSVPYIDKTATFQGNTLTGFRTTLY